MIRLLIVDDSNDKLAKVVSVVRSISDGILVETSEDFVTATNLLSTEKFDLLILDLHLPVRFGEQPSPEFGRNLLNEMSRKANLYSPKYVLCLTQYEDSLNISNSFWPVVRYSVDKEDWKEPITEIIKHIKKTKEKDQVSVVIKPTVFLEGKTDEKVFREAVRIFKPSLLDNIEIKSEKGVGGASWVARQVIAWAHSLHRDEKTGQYIKAVGLVDSDKAGNEAIGEINRVIKGDGVEATTFRTLKLSLTYAEHLRTLKTKGCLLPVCLEEMFGPEIWLIGIEKGWFNERQSPDKFINLPKNWNSYEQSFKDFLATLSLDEQERLYLNYCTDESKANFANFVIEMAEEEKRSVFRCFEKLVNDISEYFQK